MPLAVLIIMVMAGALVLLARPSAHVPEAPPPFVQPAALDAAPAPVAGEATVAPFVVGAGMAGVDDTPADSGEWSPSRRSFLYNLGMAGGSGGHSFRGHLGGPQSTLPAAVLALDWLTRHQRADGSFDSPSLPAECARQGSASIGCLPGIPGAANPTLETALALLAGLGSGSTHRSGNHKKLIKQTIVYLRGVQRPDGSFGSHQLRTHAVVTLALCEAYASSGRSPLLRPCAQSALDFLAVSSAVVPGWGETPGAPVATTDITAWAAMACKSGTTTDLDVPPAALQGARDFFATVIGADGEVAAGLDGSGPVAALKGEPLTSGTVRAARAVTSLILLGTRRGDPKLIACTTRLRAGLAGLGRDQLEALYHATLACHQLRSVDLGSWVVWCKHLDHLVRDRQVRAEGYCRLGCWDGGRALVEDCAYAVLVLQLLDHRGYQPVFATPGDPAVRRSLIEQLDRTCARCAEIDGR